MPALQDLAATLALERANVLDREMRLGARIVGAAAAGHGAGKDGDWHARSLGDACLPKHCVAALSRFAR